MMAALPVRGRLWAGEGDEDVRYWSMQILFVGQWTCSVWIQCKNPPAQRIMVDLGSINEVVMDYGASKQSHEHQSVLLLALPLFSYSRQCWSILMTFWTQKRPPTSGHSWYHVSNVPFLRGRWLYFVVNTWWVQIWMCFNTKVSNQ